MRVFRRVLLPLLLVVIWLGVAAYGGPFFGSLSEVQTSGATDFLPATADSTQVAELRREFDDSDAIPAIVLYESDDGLSAEDLAAIAKQRDAMLDLPGVDDASPPIPSAADNPEAAQIIILIDGTPSDVVEAIRDVTADTPDGIRHYVTGPAGFSADLVEAFGGIDGILLLVAVAAVFLILLLVYRSPILPILVLLSSVAALAASVVVVYYMADAGWINLNGQTQGILFILVIGAATDYALLLVARYRDALGEGTAVPAAMREAWRSSVEPIVASGGTVIAGLLCLLLSDLNSNAALGPVAAVGIVFALIASLTFLPAMLLLFGRVAFFPFSPRPRREGGLWPRVSRAVGAHPRRLWIITAVGLVILAGFASTLRADGVAETDVLIGESEAVDGFDALDDHFSAGSATPIIILAAEDTHEDVVRAVEAEPAIESVTVRSDDEPGRPGPAGPPIVVDIDGRPTVEIQATLDVAPDSDTALETVRTLRSELPGLDASVLIGGETATTVDTRDTAERDLTVIVPIVLAVILLILMLLLRSIIAPVILILTTAVSYLSTLGIAALVFNHILGFPGADPVVPLFGFVFLVALGIDYNIFLTSRVREESLLHGTREGVLNGLKVTGGVITSAGVVLAATFAALAVIPLLFLVQLAFIVAVGVLIDTIIVRSILVPGLLYDIGRPVWWPSKRITS